MIAVVILFALVGVLIVGLVAGLLLRGTIVFGDRRALDRLSSRLLAELRMEARTQATVRAMRQAAAEQQRAGRGVRRDY